MIQADPSLVTIYRYYQGNYLGTINYIWKVPLRNDHRSETENARVIARINEDLPKYYTWQMRKNALKKVSFFIIIKFFNRQNY